MCPDGTIPRIPNSPTQKASCHLRGKPACLISFFFERTFIACKRGTNVEFGQVKIKCGWWDGAGSQQRGSIPLPAVLLQTLGLRATHIVGVIILVVGQLHHPIGALESGTAMGYKLGTIQKTHITKLGSSTNPPHRDHRAGGRSGMSRGVYSLTSH